MFCKYIGFICLYRFWVRLLSWNNLLLYIFQTFSSSFIIPYSTCFRSLPLSSLTIFFTYIIDTDKLHWRAPVLSLLCPYLYWDRLEEFHWWIQIFLWVDSKNAFTNLFSKNWASLCIPLISWGTISIFPSSSRKNLRLGSRFYFTNLHFLQLNHYRYKTPC
jgi:hypothetical protein